ncbi:MAG TPA: acyl-CoA dehydrogenase family protein [Mycobacteriales bacterium]|nr:acyl-CoA dehydrogenase family protein [Mycobacteriales bacterium]
MENQELDAILAGVRDFIRTAVVPREDEIEQNDEVPADLVQAAKDMGLFGFAIPEQYGGLGLSMTEEARLVFELGWTTPSLRSLFGTNNGIAGHVLIEGGTEQQKHEWLPRLASGEVIASFGLTEPDAGSDPSTLTTRAVRDGADWVISGTKRYITNAPNADAIFVFARTDPDLPATKGIANFIVPAHSKGLTVGPKDHKMGQAGAWSADVYLDEVRVPARNIVGGPDATGSGFATAMRCLAHGRVHIAALCVGLADRLVDETVRFAAERKQGGKPIAAYQLVQGMIADSVTDLHAGRALVLETARGFDAGTDRKVGPSAAKYFCSEMVGRVADRAVQVHGGSGYIRGVPVERFFRDARLFRIYEGTSQIQQVIIAKAVLGAAAR